VPSNEPSLYARQPGKGGQFLYMNIVIGTKPFHITGDLHTPPKRVDA
jgi:hypothetical protein